MLKFIKGEYASLEGQLVEIIDISVKNLGYLKGKEPPKTEIRVTYKIKLLNDKLTHWVLESDLNKVENQKTPKILYSKPKI